MALALQQLIENHGFTAFINADNATVSFWIMDNEGNESLHTVDSVLSANIAMGY